MSKIDCSNDVKFEHYCLITYNKPYKNRRFDIVKETDIKCAKSAVAFDAGLCYLKNTFPKVKCVLLIIDDPAFLNANFEQITNHYMAIGYYQSENFPNVEVDTSPPLGKVDEDKVVQKLKDCFCSVPCKHLSKPLRKLETEPETETKSTNITKEMKGNLDTMIEIIINELAIKQARIELTETSQLKDTMRNSIRSMKIQLDATTQSLNDLEKNFVYYAKTILQDQYSKAKGNLRKILLELQHLDKDTSKKTNTEEASPSTSDIQTNDVLGNVANTNTDEKEASVITNNEKLDSVTTTSNNEDIDPKIVKTINNKEEKSINHGNENKSIDNNESVTDTINNEISNNPNIIASNDHVPEDILNNEDNNKNESNETDKNVHVSTVITCEKEQSKDNSNNKEKNDIKEKASSSKDTATPSTSRQPLISPRPKRKRTISKKKIVEGENDTDDDDKNEEEAILIGNSGETKIPKDLIKKFKGKKYSVVTRTLLTHFFSRDTLANSSMTGKLSPAFLNTDKKPRKRLDPIIVQDIVNFVTKYCNVLPTNVRATITTKCADENKMKKQREKKQ